LNPQTREKLLQVSVATLATTLFKRSLRNQTIQNVRPVKPKEQNMVGPALLDAGNFPVPRYWILGIYPHIMVDI